MGKQSLVNNTIIVLGNHSQDVAALVTAERMKAVGAAGVVISPDMGLPKANTVNDKIISDIIKLMAGTQDDNN